MSYVESKRLVKKLAVHIITVLILNFFLGNVLIHLVFAYFNWTLNVDEKLIKYGMNIGRCSMYNVYIYNRF